MDERTRRIRAKIPGEDTGITVKHSVCDICCPGPHCGIDCYVKDGRIIKVEGTKEHPTNHGLLCPKGQSNRQYVYRKDRIRSPLRRVGPKGSGKFEAISWEEALDEVAGRMLDYKRDFGPESVVFFSGYSKWFRPFLQRMAYAFGSPNYGTESSCCFTSTIMAWRLNAGAEKCNPDLGNCKLLLGWALNTYYSGYLGVQGVIERHKNGMKVIVIDQQKTPMAERVADLFLQIRPGTDAALAFCFANLLIEHDWIDRAYIRDNVHGFEEYAAYVKRFTLEYTAELTGVAPELIWKAVQMIHENMPVAIHETGAALVHHMNGMQTYRAIMALSALTGNFDRPGGNIPTFMTYAHSMGGFQTLEPEFAEELRPDLLPVGCAEYPIWHDVIGEMQAMELPRQILEAAPYPIKMVWAHGMNFRMWQDSGYMKKALEELEFFVDIDLFLTDTAKMADLVLPACSGFERGEFRVHGGCHVTYTQPVIAPLYESRSDTDIIFDLCSRLQLDDPYMNSDYDTCLRHMLRGNPTIDIDELKKRTMPLQVKEPTHQAGTWKFKTPSGKFELWSEVIAKHADEGYSPIPVWRDPLPGDGEAYPFTMCCGIRRSNVLHSRLHDMPWLRTLHLYPTVQINEEDAAQLGIEQGEMVEVYTDVGCIALQAEITAFIQRKTLITYHGYREADGNSLMHFESRDPYSGFPSYKSYRCALRKKVQA